VIEAFFKKAKEGEVIKIAEPETIVNNDEREEEDLVGEEVLDNPVVSEEHQEKEIEEEMFDNPVVSEEHQEEEIEEEMFDNPVASGEYQQAQKEVNEEFDEEPIETSEPKEEKDYFKIIQEGINEKDPIEVGFKDKRTGRVDSWGWRAVDIVKSINNQPDKIRIEKKVANGGVSLKLVDLNDLMFKKSDQFRV
ncbi:MAG: hypothetical protein WC290_02280, partial [archaeon]